MSKAGSSNVPFPPPTVQGNPDLPPPEFNTGVAHPARVYDYWLGGKDNYAADRVLGDAVIAAMPSTRSSARGNRAFLGRAVRYLAAEAGIRQFLDIGTGIPTAGNTHEVAQAAAPESRIVYVDNDPIVMAHARALMTSHPAGATAFLRADLREPGRILADPELRATLDLGKPVALMLVAVLHFLTDTDHPRDIVAELVGALPSGSYLTISNITADFDPDSAAVARFFTGLDLVDPGVVPLLAWRPDDGTPEDPFAVPSYAAMGRKP
jgi:hypothetical protein